MRSSSPALSIRGLAKTYDDGTVGLDGLDLEVPAGEFFGLLGPNGAGKTTLINSICNLIRLSSGEIDVFGHDHASMQARRVVGVAEQDPNLDRFLTVRESLVYHGGYFGMPARAAARRADEMIDVFDLRAKANVRTNKLSGGMKRRLLLARALLHEPLLVILDEPTAGVDVELRHELWRYIRRLHEQGTTILLTTHYLEEAESLCEDVALIAGGRIVARDTPDGLKRTYDATSLEQVYLQTVSTSLPLVMAAEEAMSAPAATAPAAATAESLQPDPWRSLRSLALRECRRVVRLWTQTILAPVVSSALFILVFGLSLGSRITDFEGVPYEQFIVGGLIAMAMAQAAFSNNSSTILQARNDRYINDVLASPMHPWQMNVGYALGGIFRSLAIGLALVVLAIPLTGVSIEQPFALVAATLLLVTLFGALGVVVGIYAQTFDHHSFINNILILPLTFLGGVFYSIEILPSPWEEVSHANPIFYMVNAVRYGFLGESDVSVLLSFGVTAAIAAAFVAWSQWLFSSGHKLKP